MKSEFKSNIEEKPAGILRQVYNSKMSLHFLSVDMIASKWCYWSSLNMLMSGTILTNILVCLRKLSTEALAQSNITKSSVGLCQFYNSI